MTRMVSEVYDALKSIRVDDGRARKAAEAVVAGEPGWADVRSDIHLLVWQVATLLAITVPTLWLLLLVAAKIGALP